jgi:NAD(P)-dependent dehydrogenase (short-subunit alcohol dehydrogenase family)
MLTGKVAVVTGASRGIGRAAALELARGGAATFLVARTKEACEPVAAAIRSEGGRRPSLATSPATRMSRSSSGRWQGVTTGLMSS